MRYEINRWNGSGFDVIGRGETLTEVRRTVCKSFAGFWNSPRQFRGDNGETIVITRTPPKR